MGTFSLFLSLPGHEEEERLSNLRLLRLSKHRGAHGLGLSKRRGLGMRRFFELFVSLQRFPLVRGDAAPTGDVLVLTAAILVGKHAGSRRLARKSQSSSHNWQLQLLIRLLVSKRLSINRGRQGCGTDVYPSSFRPVQSGSRGIIKTGCGSRTPLGLLKQSEDKPQLARLPAGRGRQAKEE